MASQSQRLNAPAIRGSRYPRNSSSSPETVKTHVKAILGKLGVRDRTQAVVWAHRTGFVDPSREGPCTGPRTR